jgi:hypothetical protein
MQKLGLLALIVLASSILIGCSGSGGGAVDVSAVEKQAEKEKEINKKAETNLPPGDGPAN